MISPRVRAMHHTTMSKDLFFHAFNISGHRVRIPLAQESATLSGQLSGHYVHITPLHKATRSDAVCIGSWNADLGGSRTAWKYRRWAVAGGAWTIPPCAVWEVNPHLEREEAQPMNLTGCSTCALHEAFPTIPRRQLRRREGCVQWGA